MEVKGFTEDTLAYLDRGSGHRFGNYPYNKPRDVALNKHDGYYTHSIYINSRDRTNPNTDTVADFAIDLKPKDGRITQISLKHVTFPFAFDNVTQIYGNTLKMTVYGNRIALLPVYQFTITITPAWYSIQALILELNIKIAQQLTLLGAAFQLTFTFSSINGVLQLNTTDNNVMVVFDPTTTPYNQTYLYFMLGLYKTQQTVLFQTPKLSQRLPQVASQELPFNAIIIYIDIWSNFVFTSATTAGTFIIPTAGYKQLDTISPNPSEDVSHGIVWNDQHQFTQSFTINRTLESLANVRIRLMDDRGNTLLHYIQENDWAMLVELTKMIW